jgi:plastocyanin
MRKLLVLTAVVVLGATACGGDNSSDKTTAASLPVKLSGQVNNHGQKDITGSTSAEVEQDNFYFNPTFLKASPGGTVKVELKNEGNVPHTFTIDSLHIDTEVQPGGSAEVSVTLPSSGAVTYYCRFHQSSGMQGAFFSRSGATATGAGSSSNGSGY